MFPRWVTSEARTSLVRAGKERCDSGRIFRVSWKNYYIVWNSDATNKELVLQLV